MRQLVPFGNSRIHNKTLYPWPDMPRGGYQRVYHHTNRSTMNSPTNATNQAK